MDSDYVLVDTNLESIEIENNNKTYQTYYLTEYDYYDTISNYSEYIITELIPTIYDITYVIKDLCISALNTHDEYYIFNSFNY